MFRHQHHGNRHHHFIRNRIEEGAKTGALVPATGEIAIKPVGDGGHKEDQRADKRRPDERKVERQHKKRNQDDAEQRKQCRDIILHGVVTICC